MKNRTILFYFTWQLRPVHHGIVIEKLHSLLEENKDANIHFLICTGQMKPCYTNRTGDSGQCKVCSFHSNAALSQFGDRLKVVTINEPESEFKNEFKYNSIQEIKDIVYRNVKIGYGALSSYISFTRNLEPEFDENFRSYFDSLLSNQINLTNRIIDLYELHNYESIIFFNGRTADTRPLYDISRNFSIPFISLELIKKSDTNYFINEFPNCLPHDIEYHHKRLMETWDNSSMSLEEKIESGSSFFENRRNGVLTRDRRVYTAHQIQNLLPDDWDNSKKNVAIFNSSEDEFAAIGDIFEMKAIFNSQEIGLIKILEYFKHDSDFVFYFRIHPNLASVKYQYHLRLYNLVNKYKNLRIIGPKDKVSTYAMIDAADKIIVFGSTVGVEATYWNRPTILLAGSFYYHLDAAYKPKTFEELISLLRDNELLPKNKVDAIKYGFYMMNYTQYTRQNKFSPKPLRIFGINLGLVHNHLKLLGSRTLFKIIDLLLKRWTQLFSSKKCSIPVQENLNAT